ncbi:STAS-like domain-containing protein [Candidatus Falkowbacteria bacterium]|nr:STAS-like domain-containing protein [Candidatus Falkowbacteria bacterium]
MRVELKKFGEILVSRPSGREAYLAMSAYLLKDLGRNEKIEIDFSGVKVLTPSWADEVITKIYERFENVKLVNAGNVTVQATLKTLREYSGLKNKSL